MDQHVAQPVVRHHQRRDTSLRGHGAIDWKTLERYIIQVAAGDPARDRDEHGGQRGQLAGVSEQLGHPALQGDLGGRVHLLSGLNVTHTAAASITPGGWSIPAPRVGDLPPVPAFLSAPSVSMLLDYLSAVAEAVRVPLLAVQTNFCGYPKGTIAALSQIPSIVAIKDASFNVEQTLDNVKEANGAKRKIGVLTGGDTFILEAMLMGCDGALIGFAATGTAELVRMHTYATQCKITEAYEIWGKLGALARICWRQPIRDYRVRTKYALMKQGVLPTFKVRAPFPTIADADRADIDQAFRDHDLGNPRFLPAGAQSAPRIKAEAAAAAK